MKSVYRVASNILFGIISVQVACNSVDRDEDVSRISPAGALFEQSSLKNVNLSNFSIYSTTNEISYVNPKNISKMVTSAENYFNSFNAKEVDIYLHKNNQNSSENNLNGKNVNYCLQCYRHFKNKESDKAYFDVYENEKHHTQNKTNSSNITTNNIFDLQHNLRNLRESKSYNRYKNNCSDCYLKYIQNNVTNKSQVPLFPIMRRMSLELRNVTTFIIQNLSLQNSDEGLSADNLEESKFRPVAGLSRRDYCRMGATIALRLPTEEGFYDNQTCYFCYAFTPPHRKKHLLDIRTNVFVTSFQETFVKFYFVENETAYNFSPDDTESWERISSSMIDVTEAKKLKFCCSQAVECCRQMIHRNDAKDGTSNHCPRTWDGWSCIADDVSGGETVEVSCPIYAYKEFPTCIKKAKKRCLQNGTWETKNNVEWTDYTSCSLRSVILTLFIWEICMHSLSIGFLVPAVAVLLYFRPLRVQRFLMHLNFFFALMGRSIFKILELSTLKIPEVKDISNVLETNGVGCKILVFFGKYFLLATWTWMLAESFYLHHLIARAFRRPATIRVFLIVGWGSPAVIAGIWAVTRGILEDLQCWLGDAKGDPLRLHLVTEVFQIVILVVNIILLVDMARVLGTKLRGVNTNNSAATKKAVKATIFLIPMFGLQFMLTMITPKRSMTSCAGMSTFMFIATAVNGLQGVYVSIIYCYINAEVRMNIRRYFMMRFPTLFEKVYQTTSTVDTVTTYSQIQSEGYSMALDEKSQINDTLL